MKKIVVEKLTKIFGHHPSEALKLLEEGLSKEEILAKTGDTVGVSNVSFEVEEGEILVVMGLSGSGKSTLIRLINRLIEPTSGKVFLEDQEVTSLSPEDLRVLRQKRLSMVFQNFALFPHMTVLENTAFGLTLKGMDIQKRNELSMRALEQVGLKGWEDKNPSELSGGMQQRVGLARALAMDTDIMLMDEAFSALDPLIRRDMQDELLTLQEKLKKTILFISHDLDEALKLGDRIVLMKDGAVIQIGTGEEILENPATEYVKKFVEDVDKTKVITASSVMLHPKEMASLKTDGPRAALRKMKHEGISSIFVKKEGKLVGIVSADDAAEAVKRGERSLEKIMQQNYIKVSPDTPANDLIPILAEGGGTPIAVVDEEEHLKGVIVRGSLLAALS
jgi:glycine betaine/proline transport system ATP-binding protein